jgi:hypothetical protein
MRWFRFYDDAINDPKILKLPDASRWHWTALLCIASKHDGFLPSTEDVALMMRVKTSAAAAIIATMKAAGLLDLVDGRYAPHNWSGRQYKSDSSAERVKRHRDKQRNVTITVQNRTESETEQKEDKIVEGASRFTQGSKGLADAFLRALGFDTPLKVPPEYAGVDWRATTWETAGWTADLIEADIRRIGPGKPISYYEKVFATSFAGRQAPLPVVEVKEAETVTVTHGRRVQETKSLSHIARRHAEEGISFGERPASPSARLNASVPDVRLLSQGGSERPGDLRGGNGVGSERIPAGSDRLHHGPEDGIAEQITVVAERVRG